MRLPFRKQSSPDELRTRATLLGGLGAESNRDAWLLFYEMYQGVILGMARKNGLTEASSWDVLQEVMLAVNRVSKSFTYDPDKRVFIANPDKAMEEGTEKLGGFRQWLFIVVRRAIWKHRSNPKRQREVLFSDMSGQDETAAAFVNKLPAQGLAPDAVAEEKSQEAYAMALFEQAIRLLPECTKKAHPRKLAIFLALKQPHVLDTLVGAASHPLPEKHMAEITAISRLRRDASGGITKAALLEHYGISSNHLDQEVKATKEKLAEIYRDLVEGHDPREN